MYNRYIPQNDGSFQKHPTPEPKSATQQRGTHRRPEPPNPAPAPSTPAPQPPKPPQATNAGSFLRNLLPREFDTGDLIVVLLLLLMAGDCEEERNNALLTLALYFFM